MHMLTLRVYSRTDKELKIEQTSFVDHLSHLQQVGQEFELTVNGVTEQITIELEFNPPIRLDDDDPPTEAEAGA